ncbi:MAG: ATP-binding protein, partial [Verrucomicrobiae bacterium]|nr:ATP-binding protein [Verrucomicrobiae bacterium]
ITDRGIGFDGNKYLMSGLRQKDKRGHGLFVVKTYMDEVFFDNRGRTVTLIKKKA